MSSERRDASGETPGPAVTATRERLDEVTRQSIERRVEAAAAIAEPLYQRAWDGVHDEVAIDPDLVRPIADQLRHMHRQYREWIECYVDARWAGEAQPDLATPPPRPIIETIHIPLRQRIRSWLTWTPTGWECRDHTQSALPSCDAIVLQGLTGDDAIVTYLMCEDALIPVSDDGINFRWE